MPLNKEQKNYSILHDPSIHHYPFITIIIVGILYLPLRSKALRTTRITINTTVKINTA